MVKDQITILTIIVCCVREGGNPHQSESTLTQSGKACWEHVFLRDKDVFASRCLWLTWSYDPSHSVTCTPAGQH